MEASRHAEDQESETNMTQRKREVWVLEKEGEPITCRASAPLMLTYDSRQIASQEAHPGEHVERYLPASLLAEALDLANKLYIDARMGSSCIEADKDTLARLRAALEENVSEQNPSTLGDALPAEMARVRDDVLPHYLEIGPPGAFGAAMIRMDLDAAAKALAEGDVVAMLRAYQKLKEIKS